MALLPKLLVPTFPYTLPLSKQAITYRPFTVKEEKILLIAAESKETKDLVHAFNQIVSNCVAEPIDAQKLPIFDLEVLFVLLRIASVSNISDFIITDPDDLENPVKVSLDLQKVIEENVATAKLPEKTIKLNDTVGVVMREITLSTFNDKVFDSADLTTTDAFDIMAGLIEKVYDEDNVYLTAEFKKEEVIEFIEGFTSSAIEQVYEYVNSVPRLRHILPYVLKDGTKKEMKLEGLVDFFQYA